MFVLAAAIFLVVSPLILHEMGHWMALARYGVPVREVWVGLGPRLWGVGWLRFGMLPIGGAVVPEPEPYANAKPEQRLVVALAGPAVSVVYGLILEVLSHHVPSARDARVLYGVAQLNYFLAGVNLLPIPPLDGFQAMTAFLEARGKPLSKSAMRYAGILGNGMIYGVGFMVLIKFFVSGLN